MVRKTKPDPTKIYIAWQGVACDVDGVPYVAARSTRLKGSHPLVQHVGAAGFVEDGTPENEWPTVFDAAIAMADAEAKAAPPPPPPRIDAKTPIGELVIAHTGIVMSSAGPCPAGYIAHRNDLIVLAAPEALSPLVDTL